MRTPLLISCGFALWLHQCSAAVEYEVNAGVQTIEEAFNKGNSLLQAGDPASAKVYYQQAINIQPTHLLPYVTSGIASFQLRQHEEAESYYKIAVELDPQSFHGHFNRGNNWVSMGRMAEAISSLQKAVDVSPNEPQAQSALDLAKNNQRSPNFQYLLQTNMQLLRQDQDNLIISHYASDDQGPDRMGGLPVKRRLPNMIIEDLDSDGEDVIIVQRPPWCNSTEEIQAMDRLVHRYIAPSQISVQISKNLFVGYALLSSFSCLSYPFPP
jgi:tetratricopeptide (TPR) repeat protein